MNVKRWSIWIVAIVAGIALAVFLVMRSHRWRPRTLVIQGAVLRKDEDPRKRLPIGGANITATDGVATANAQSDASGFFSLRLKENVWPGAKLQVSFDDQGYRTLHMTVPLGPRLTAKKLYIAEMEPVEHERNVVVDKKASVISNVRVRYTINMQGDENIGSAVRTFQVANRGNVPCNNQTPCSPDGNWKAATGSATLDAGPNNEFRNVRASCIAGPCPFTRIDPSGFEHGGQVVTARALDWSDTATFLLEAEVFRKQINSSVRESYPVIFGRTLNFVLPASEEGVSLEADMDGQPMVFPLGPELYLSWATCSARTTAGADSSTVYRCELKPGYRF